MESVFDSSAAFCTRLRGPFPESPADVRICSNRSRPPGPCSSRAENRKTQAIVPEKFRRSTGRDGNEKEALTLMPCEYRTGMSVVVVLGIVEG
jgi:hypothetical protein